MEARDALIVEAAHVGDAPRVGEVLAVLGEPENPHFSVRWDDGHVSIFYPDGNVTLRHSTASQ